MAHQIDGVRTIIDIGGQDTKAIAIGENGEVRRFLMNDKCAAGSGRFLEVMARTLEIDLEDFEDKALQGKSETIISSLMQKRFSGVFRYRFSFEPISALRPSDQESQMGSRRAGSQAIPKAVRSFHAPVADAPRISFLDQFDEFFPVLC